MPKLIVHMHIALDNRISNPDGLFWEPFPFGDDEMSFINDAFRAAGTWAMSRKLYEFVVPYWEQVAAGLSPEGGEPATPAQREFADLLVDLDKVVFSRTLRPDPVRRRQVVAGDLATHLRQLKSAASKDILLSAGPATMASLAAESGLVDEYLLVVHPAVLAAGPRLFDGMDTDLAFRLLHAEVFPAGAIVARYEVQH